MTITKATGYKASDGVVYSTYEEAQRSELTRLFTPTPNTVLTTEMCVEWVLNNQVSLLEWLTSGPKSRPGARKKAGTTNIKRATRAQANAGFKAMHAAAEGTGPTETAA